MITLDSSTKKIRVTLGEVISTVNCTVVASYTRRVLKYSGQQGSLNSYVPFTIENEFDIEQTTTTNGTTPVDIVPYPDASDDVWKYTHNVNTISIHNTDSIAHIVIVTIYSGSDSTIAKFTVDPESAIYYNSGWYVLDMSGRVLSTVTSVSALPILLNGKIWIGDATNAAVAQAPSGDVSMTNTGVFTLVASINKAITGIWSFVSAKFRLYNSASTFYTSVETSASANNVWTVPNTGTQTFASEAYADAKVADAIVDAVTTIAPSQNAVFDALALKQPLDGTLTALAGLTIAADSLSIGTGVDAFNQTTFAANTFPAKSSAGVLSAKTITDFALTILDDIDAATVRATIGAGTGSGNALTSNPLSQFAATTSAQLAGVISDETGSNKLVFSDAPTLLNPVVGTQTASDNSTKAASTAYADAKVTDAIVDAVTTIAPSQNAVFDALALKQPLDSDLTTIAGLTPTTDNFIQSKSGAWASRTVAQVYTDLQPSVKDDVYFTFYCLYGGTTPLADSSVWHFLNSGISPTAANTDTNNDFNFGYAVNLIAATVMVFGNTTAGTSENVTLALRNTTQATTTTIGTFTTNGGSATVVANTTINGLNIPIASSDFFTLRVTNPVWVTNPIAAVYRVLLTFKRV